MCTDRSCGRDVRQDGATLVELILFIVIVSIAVAGILLVMNKVTAHSSDALLRKQSLAAAESLLEEIELHDFLSQSGVTSPVTQANRATTYHVVRDYDRFTTNGVYAPDGTAPVQGLGGYNVTVSVAPDALGSISLASASAVKITVAVTDPAGAQVQVDGYRTAYR